VPRQKGAVTASTAPAARAQPAKDDIWGWAVGLTLLFLIVRLAAIRFSPLQLYADEAQYWLWSRQLDFGYFTKPPLIAWIIRATTLAGDAEPLVRLSSPLLHAAAGLFLFLAGRRLYDARVALYSLLVYELMPAVQLGAFVVSTDTPLVACLAAALWAYVALQTASGRRRLLAAAGLGLALGLAFLAKYAALYSVGGVALHLALSRSGRKAWTPAAALVAAGVFALAIAPNLVWNIAHGLAAFRHLAGEAAWGARRGGPLEALNFLGSQFGVFGPIPFAVLAGGGIWLAARRKLTAADGLLLAWATPPLLIVLAQALIAGAKANWAAAAFAPGSILVAAWMLRWGRPRILIAVLIFQALVAFCGVVAVTSPGIVDRVGLGGALKGVRGGRALSEMVIARARTESFAGPLTAVAVDDRGLFGAIAYYGRDYFGHDGPPLKAWLSGPEPKYQAELSTPLTAAAGQRVLGVSRDGVYVDAMKAQFQQASPTDIGDVWIDRKHRLKIEMFVGTGFKPPAAKR
jgi:Dolichyl-phosphate-mannose-protein mannosyltransferase